MAEPEHDATAPEPPLWLHDAEEVEQKYEEAVADAVEERADDTAGQTCFICLDGAEDEGLVRGCACRGTAGFAHVSCLAEQATILFAEAEENNWDDDRFMPRWRRWDTCSLCEQEYHGVVMCALGWACWKTYVGRPEADWARGAAMTELGLGLSEGGQHEDALAVREVQLATKRRLRVSEEEILRTQGNLANTYCALGRFEEALSMLQDMYSGWSKLKGEDHSGTLIAANNYAAALNDLQRFEEAKALLRSTLPVAQRVLGESHDLTLTMRKISAAVLCNDPGATLDDMREAVTTLEESERVARRVYGGAHPLASGIEHALRNARAALRARETPPSQNNDSL